MNRDDLVTWKTLRALAQVEILTLNPKRKARVVAMNLDRPQITWSSQYSWFHEATTITPTAGDVVFARAGWRSPWRQGWMPKVPDPIVLVSTFYDRPIKTNTLMDVLRPGSPVAHWFGVQAKGTHPNFTAMPIGVKSKMIPFLKAGERRETRDILCYANFAYTRVGLPVDMERYQLWQWAQQQPWITTRACKREDPMPYMHDLGRSQFVLSPPGLGVDCYRTYEAIAMGAIPIVRRQPGTEVCESLPVVLVDDWSDVTPERLADARAHVPISTNMLTLSYWRNCIQAAAAAAKELVCPPPLFEAAVSATTISPSGVR